MICKDRYETIQNVFLNSTVQTHGQNAEQEMRRKGNANANTRAILLSPPAYTHIYILVRGRHAGDRELDAPLLIRMALALSNGEVKGSGDKRGELASP